MARVSVGDRHEACVIEEMSRTHLVKYAGASGGLNATHHDDTYARKMGYPSIFAHGAFTMGVTATMLTDWLGAGNLRSYGVRFLLPVWPGDTLTASGEVVGIDERDGEYLATVRLRTVNQDGKPVIEGECTAVVEPQ
jgi:acyl dehydratase